MTLTQAGFWAASGTAAGILGRLTISIATKHGYRVAVTTVLLAVSAGTTLALVLLSGPGLVANLLVFSVARSPLMPLVTLLLMETPGVGARRMGAAAGLYFTAAEVGGFGGAVLLGLLRDATDSLTSGVVVVAIIIAALALVTPFIKEQRRLQRHVGHQ